jgi:hypothetical protein
MNYLYPALALSVFGNLALIILLALSRRSPPRKKDITAEELLYDLLDRQQAILRVTVINPENLMLRSHRT